MGVTPTSASGSSSFFVPQDSSTDDSPGSQDPGSAANTQDSFSPSSSIAFSGSTGMNPASSQSDQ